MVHHNLSRDVSSWNSSQVEYRATCWSTIEENSTTVESDAQMHTQSQQGEFPQEKNYRDDAAMAIFGKRQQLKRRFGFLSILGLTTTLLSTWEGALSLFSTGLTNGGPSGVVYGFLLVWLGTMFQTLTMGEMASMIPLSGGAYNWVAVLSPPSCSKFLSYITGWVTVLGWQAATTGASFITAFLIQGLIVLNNPDYTPQPWQTVLLTYAIIGFSVIFNTYLATQLPAVESVALVIQVLSFFAILIPLVHLAPHGDPSAVFQTFSDQGNWDSIVLSFFIGLSSSMLDLIGVDAATHMAEEIQNAAMVIPWSMIASIGINGTMGFSMVIALLFCAGNFQDDLESPTGVPAIQIFYQATGSVGGASIMTSIVITAQLFASVGLVASSSRLVWAFAREKGLPGYKYLARVEPRTALPLWSIALTMIITLLLGLIELASEMVLSAALSLVVASFYSTFLVSSTVFLIKRINKPSEIRWGPFRLYKMGIPVNIVAIIWTLFGIFFSFWPSHRDVTPSSMNYSSIVYISTLVFSTGFWFLHSRKFYTGPVVER